MWGETVPLAAVLHPRPIARCGLIWVILHRGRLWQFGRVIPEIDIWRAAMLMLKRYADKAEAESTARADELSAAGDHGGATVWRRITRAVVELANKTPPRCA